MGGGGVTRSRGAIRKCWGASALIIYQSVQRTNRVTVASLSSLVFVCSQGLVYGISVLTVPCWNLRNTGFPSLLFSSVCSPFIVLLTPAPHPPPLAEAQTPSYGGSGRSQDHKKKARFCSQGRGRAGTSGSHAHPGKRGRPRQAEHEGSRPPGPAERRCKPDPRQLSQGVCFPSGVATAESPDGGTQREGACLPMVGPQTFLLSNAASTKIR